jgi:hypothetical protein
LISRPHVLVSALLLSAVVASGCDRKPVAGARAASPAPAQSASAGSQAQPAQPGHPGDVTTVTGTVVEAMNASSYTYVRVDTGSGEIWAAASQFDVAVGDRVVVPLETPMENFHSPSLNRDFPIIYFSSSITREGEPGAAAGQGGRPRLMSSRESADAPAPGGSHDGPVQPIAPPQGGLSIATVWADRASLAGKQVTVSGKVVKFTAGVLGRNWLHVQDGSGAAGDGTHDLTVTTTGEAKVGDVVVATGTVAVDEDFGSGYSYKVMVKDARLSAR